MPPCKTILVIAISSMLPDLVVIDSDTDAATF
jgi:hypothetical protein